MKKTLKNEKPLITAPLPPIPVLWLVAAVLLLYFPTLNLGFTELDDTIFVREMEPYNRDLGNLATSFGRGVFSDTADVYYRPLLLDSFVLNHRFSGTSVRGYHLVNLLFHLGAVLLLFSLLQKLRLPRLSAFLLTLLFAVHPVLCQAVAWIPGRNDTMLAVFTFAFLIGVIDFSETGRWSRFALQFAVLVAAFFTKETAVFAAPVAFVLLVFLREKNWLDRRSLWLYGSWAAAFGLWWWARSLATLKQEQLDFAQVVAALPGRLPVVVQYFGKIILPLNLNVFPIQRDTSSVFGLVAIGLLAAGLFFAKDKNTKTALAGLLIFGLFLLPVLLVPNTLNDQDFEHRLYLPMLGALILLSQTLLFRNKLSEKTLLWAGVAVCAVLAAMNLWHQKKFSDPITFWTEAQRNSPHSAYANMMLGARLDETDLPRARALIREAYALNPDEKFLNYYMGKMLLDTDSTDAALRHFEREIKRSGYYECYFHAAQIAFNRKDFAAAAGHLEHFLQAKPTDGPANNNLLLLYLETKQLEKARAHAAKMKALGMPVPPQIIQQLNAQPAGTGLEKE